MFRISLAYDAPGKGGKSPFRTNTYYGHFPGSSRSAGGRGDRAGDCRLPTQEPDDLTTTLTGAEGGTEILFVHDRIPVSVQPLDNEAGTRMALANLAALVEADSRQ